MNPRPYVYFVSYMPLNHSGPGAVELRTTELMRSAPATSFQDTLDMAQCLSEHHGSPVGLVAFTLLRIEPTTDTTTEPALTSPTQG
jgi:hypothetical protein